MDTAMKNLREENQELKRALAVLMNRKLIRNLSEALNRINSGNYISEQEFFRNSLR